MEWFFGPLIVFLVIVIAHGFYRVGLELGRETVEHTVRHVHFDSIKVGAVQRVSSEELRSVPSDFHNKIMGFARDKMLRELYEELRQYVRVWEEHASHMDVTEIRGELLVGVQR